MSHYTRDFEGILRAAGYRVTPQRIQILDALCDEGGHTSLAAIYLRLQRIDPTIDKSTVYRALKLFVTLGLVVSADNGDGEVYYEIARVQPHHHLVCRQCGQQQEIDHDAIQLMAEAIYQQYGFQVNTDHLMLNGICAGCRLPHQ